MRFKFMKVFLGLFLTQIFFFKIKKKTEYFNFKIAPSLFKLSVIVSIIRGPQ